MTINWWVRFVQDYISRRESMGMKLGVKYIPAATSTAGMAHILDRLHHDSSSSLVPACYIDSCEQ